MKRVTFNLENLLEISIKMLLLQVRYVLLKLRKLYQMVLFCRMMFIFQLYILIELFWLKINKKELNLRLFKQDHNLKFLEKEIQK